MLRCPQNRDVPDSGQESFYAGKSGRPDVCAFFASSRSPSSSGHTQRLKSGEKVHLECYLDHLDEEKKKTQRIDLSPEQTTDVDGDSCIRKLLSKLHTPSSLFIELDVNDSLKVRRNLDTRNIERANPAAR